MKGYLIYFYYVDGEGIKDYAYELYDTQEEMEKEIKNLASGLDDFRLINKFEILDYKKLEI